jgi:hypothetical protein
MERGGVGARKNPKSSGAVAPETVPGASISTSGSDMREQNKSARKGNAKMESEVGVPLYLSRRLVQPEQ